jgi:hypothetical protein
MGCLTSISFVVIVNGSTSKFFNPKRGSRQGCLLSPLLFLIVVEGFKKLEEWELSMESGLEE